MGTWNHDISNSLMGHSSLGKHDVVRKSSVSPRRPLGVASWIDASINAPKKPQRFLCASCCSFVVFSSGTGAMHQAFTIMAVFRIRLWFCAPVQFEVQIQEGSCLECIVSLMVQQSFVNSPSGPTQTWSCTWCTRHLTPPWGSHTGHHHTTHHHSVILHTVGSILERCQDINQIPQNVPVIQSNLVLHIQRTELVLWNWEYWPEYGQLGIPLCGIGSLETLVKYSQAHQKTQTPWTGTFQPYCMEANSSKI